MLKEQIDSLLDRVQKPARYMGGEMNCVLKDPKSVDIRYAFAFPDVYEVGMSHLGSRILYDIINKREDALCERVYDEVVRERVEAGGDVALDKPAGTRPGMVDLMQGSMASPAGAKPMGGRAKLRLVVGFKEAAQDFLQQFV